MTDEVLAALRAMRAECARAEEAEEWDTLYSVRSLANRLGYNHLVKEILAACNEGGFKYCLDYTIRYNGYAEGRGEFPNQNVCFWGVDQLRSRLDSVDYRIYQNAL